MKKILLFLALLAFLATPAFASVGVRVGGTLIGTATDLYFPSGTTYTFDGSTFGTSTLTGAVAAITSGTIDGAVIGGVSPVAGSFAALVATSISGSGNATVSGTLAVTGAVTLSSTLTTAGDITMSSGTAGAVLCLTTGHALGHCTEAASCSSTCTCTCAAN